MDGDLVGCFLSANIDSRLIIEAYVVHSYRGGHNRDSQNQCVSVCGDGVSRNADEFSDPGRRTWQIAGQAIGVPSELPHLCSIKAPHGSVVEVFDVPAPSL